MMNIRTPVNLPPWVLERIIARCAEAMVRHADELTQLDQAIGDGDHGANMIRGFGAIAEIADDLKSHPLGAALHEAGTTLVMKVGGASGPLFGSLLISMGKAAPAGPVTKADVASMLRSGVKAVMTRGKSQYGEKTMLDVLVPVLDSLQSASGSPNGPQPPGSQSNGPHINGHSHSASSYIERARHAADRGARATVEMQALKGRASFLGERSVGHMDPGARSSALLVHAICDVLEETSANQPPVAHTDGAEHG
ncbi:MAG: dihydroxyacetone kinase subunit DhaL [Pseudomonadota bacterium]